MQSDVLFVPEVNSLNHHLVVESNLSNTDNFYKQQSSFAVIKKCALQLSALAPWVEMMFDRQLAVCQEPITARQIKLIPIKLNRSD